MKKDAAEHSTGIIKKSPSLSAKTPVIPEGGVSPGAGRVHFGKTLSAEVHEIPSSYLSRSVSAGRAPKKRCVAGMLHSRGRALKRAIIQATDTNRMPSWLLTCARVTCKPHAHYTIQR